MPVVNLAPIARKQYLDASGDPVVGGLLFTYAAGSSTKQATYTDSTGTTANSNPIVLDAAGRTPTGVWYEAGLIYKEVLALSTDTDPPTSPIYTADGLEGVNDTTTPAALAASSQWVDSGLTPTYVSATQFTLAGDQTAAFHVGRRVRFTVTAGTVYGRISVSAFGALTTVTVVLDSGALDSGLSAVDVGILTALNRSMPEPSSVGYQPLDATTTALGALDATPGLVEQTGADTFTKRAIGTAEDEVPVVGTKSATELLAGLVELATTAEAAALTDTDRAVTAAGVAAAILAKLNATGAAPVYACRAWISFDGASGSIGTGRGSGNVSSVTDNGTGDYTINFTTAMPDANYAVVGMASRVANTGVIAVEQGTTPTASAVRVRVANSDSNAPTDYGYVNIAIYR